MECDETTGYELVVGAILHGDTEPTHRVLMIDSCASVCRQLTHAIISHVLAVASVAVVFAIQIVFHLSYSCRKPDLPLIGAYFKLTLSLESICREAARKGICVKLALLPLGNAVYFSYKCFLSLHYVCNSQ